MPIYVKDDGGIDIASQTIIRIRAATVNAFNAKEVVIWAEIRAATGTEEDTDLTKSASACRTRIQRLAFPCTTESALQF
jgi:hypothetical protein